MPNLKQIYIQELNEKTYNRKHIDGYLRESIENNPDMCARLLQGVTLVEQYMAGNYYASKNARIQQLIGLDIAQLVLDIFVGVAYCLKEELFTAVSAQMASRLKFSDKLDAIKTTAELMAVLCATDAYDINKADKSASLMLVSCIPLEQKLIDFINNSAYLPPMVCQPLELTNNYSSGYLSHSDGLILGSGNMHDGDVCLDVLNLINKVQLRIDTDFVSKVEEEPTFELDTAEKRDSWTNFKRQSYEFYLLLATQGNKFYLTNKVDKRGRIYAQGYNVTTQGAAFKKAMLELAQEELVEVVPTN